MPPPPWQHPPLQPALSAYPPDMPLGAALAGGGLSTAPPAQLHMLPPTWKPAPYAPAVPLEATLAVGGLSTAPTLAVGGLSTAPAQTHMLPPSWQPTHNAYPSPVVPLWATPAVGGLSTAPAQPHMLPPSWQPTPTTCPPAVPFGAAPVSPVGGLSAVPPLGLAQQLSSHGSATMPPGLPAYSFNQCPDRRFVDLTLDVAALSFVFKEIYSKEPQLQPHHDLLLKSWERWRSVLQQSSTDHATSAMWAHQLQQRVELSLRTALASVLLKQEGLVWTSMLPLPLCAFESEDRKTHGGFEFRFCAVGAADKKENVGGELNLNEPMRANPLLARMILTDTSGRFRVKEGTLVKSLHDVIYKHMSAIQLQQDLSPQQDDDMMPCALMVTLLERGDVPAHETVVAATLLAHVLAQRYDTTSPLWLSPLATWHSVVDSWYYKRLGCLGLRIGTPYLDILGFGLQSSSTTESIFASLKIGSPTACDINKDSPLSVPALVHFWMTRFLADSCTLVFDVGAYTWVSKLVLHASILEKPPVEALFPLCNARKVVVHARRTASGHARTTTTTASGSNEYSLCLLSLLLALLVPIGDGRIVCILMCVPLPSDSDADALWLRHQRLNRPIVQRELSKFRHPFANGGHIMGSNFNHLLGHTLLPDGCDQATVFYKNVLDIFEVMQRSYHSSQENTVHVLKDYGAYVFGGGLGGTDLSLHRISTSKCTDRGCTDAWTLWLTDGSGLIAAFEDLHPMWSQFFSSAAKEVPLQLEEVEEEGEAASSSAGAKHPISAEVASSTAGAKRSISARKPPAATKRSNSSGPSSSSSSSMQSQDSAYNLRCSTIQSSLGSTSSRVGERFQVQSSTMDDCSPTKRRMDKKLVIPVVPVVPGRTRRQVTRMEGMNAAEVVDDGDMLSFAGLTERTEGRISVISQLLRGNPLQDILNLAKSNTEYVAIYNSSNRATKDNLRAGAPCPEACALACTKNLNRMMTQPLLGLRKERASFLRSEPACKQQQSHFDFEQSRLKHHLEQKGDMPKTLLVSLEDGGVLPIQDIYSQWYFIHLKAGDAVLFDGNIRHCGGAYSYLHHRLHIYLDPISVLRPSNASYNSLLAMDEAGETTLDLICPEEDIRTAQSTLHVSRSGTLVLPLPMKLSFGVLPKLST